MKCAAFVWFHTGSLRSVRRKTTFLMRTQTLTISNPVNWHDEGKPKKWVWYRDTPVLQSLYKVPAGLSFLHVWCYTSKANNKGWARGRGINSTSTHHKPHEMTRRPARQGCRQPDHRCLYFVPNLCFEAITWTWRTHWLIPIWTYSKGESLNKMRFLLASHESNERCLLSMQKHKTRI